MKEINHFQDEVNKDNSSEADGAKQKLCLCFLKNEGFKVICEISHVL
jgi:hypothetical protein